MLTPAADDRRPRELAGPSRRILAVFPRYAKSFGTFDHAFGLLGVRAFMPPQGLLTIASYLPSHWDVRLIDENVLPVQEEDLAWAEAVLITGMHVQRRHIDELAPRARAAGRITVLGGPSVSASPGLYPDIDLLHVGELGDATDELIARLHRDVAIPSVQEVYRTVERLPMDQFPPGAYQLIDLHDYLLASIQFCSGCPFQCELCDIPALYGRRPRLKRPEQVTTELDAMLTRGNPGTVYLVDDNFIGNPHAALALLQHLVGWQEERGFPITFACEATMNLTQRPDILALMQQARFTTTIMGVESPDPAALQLMGKRQNLRSPLLEAVSTVNSYGIEVVAGIILGLDSDDEQSGRRVVEFIEASRIPMLTINLLHALPITPLWDRLEKSGRIVPSTDGRESNVEFLLPYDSVVAMWRETVTTAFDPEAVYARFATQLTATYPHQRSTRQRPSPADVLRGLRILTRILWHIGARGDYRRLFWRTALPLLCQGRVEELIHLAAVSHHLITFAREAADGTAEKAFYSARTELAEGPQPGLRVVAELATGTG